MMGNIDEKLGDRIQLLRRRLKKNQAELAADAEISERGLQAIEIGKSKDPGISTVAKIANALGVSIDDLYSGETAPRIVAAEKADLIIDIISMLPKLHQEELGSIHRQVKGIAIDADTAPAAPSPHVSSHSKSK